MCKNRRGLDWGRRKARPLFSHFTLHTSHLHPLHWNRKLRGFDGQLIPHSVLTALFVRDSDEGEGDVSPNWIEGIKRRAGAASDCCSSLFLPGRRTNFSCASLLIVRLTLSVAHHRVFSSTLALLLAVFFPPSPNVPLKSGYLLRDRLVPLHSALVETLLAPVLFISQEQTYP